MPELLDGQTAEVWGSGATSTSATSVSVRTGNMGNPCSSRWRHRKRLWLTQRNSFRKRRAGGVRRRRAIIETPGCFVPRPFIRNLTLPRSHIWVLAPN